MAGTFKLGGLFGDGDFAYVDGQFPVWNAAKNRFQPSSLRQVVISGGAAGDLAVTGIDPHDSLVAVQRFVGAGVAVTDVADLTSEFTITAVDTINNTGGTNTTGDKLVVWWIDRNLS